MEYKRKINVYVVWWVFLLKAWPGETKNDKVSSVGKMLSGGKEGYAPIVAELDILTLEQTKTILSFFPNLSPRSAHFAFERSQ